MVALGWIGPGKIVVSAFKVSLAADYVVECISEML